MSKKDFEKEFLFEKSNRFKVDNSKVQIIFELDFGLFEFPMDDWKYFAADFSPAESPSKLDIVWHGRIHCLAYTVKAAIVGSNLKALALRLLFTPFAATGLLARAMLE